MRFHAMLSVAALTTALVACSSAVQRGRPDHELITQQELVAHNFQNAYEAVVALHGNWLNVRPNTLLGTQEQVRIYHDEVRMAGPDDLRNINVRTIDHIQHYDAVAATTRWGVGHSQGAIQVVSVP